MVIQALGESRSANPGRPGPSSSHRRAIAPNSPAPIHPDFADGQPGENLRTYYQLLSDHAHEITLFIRLSDGRILEANRAAEEAYGYTHAELLECSISDLRAPETLDNPSTQMQKAQAGGIIFETFHRRKDGQRFRVEVSSREDVLEGEQIDVSIIRDISWSTLAEEALGESEERYRLIVENLNIGIVIHIDNRIVYANHAARKIIGSVDAGEVLGKSIFDYVVLDKQAGLANLVQNAYLVGNKDSPTPPLVIEERIVRLDGTILTVEVSAMVVNYYGKSALLVIVNDITERKQTEAALRASENKYRILVENLPQKIFSKDRNSAYISSNENYARDLGISSDEIIGRTDYDFFPKPMADAFRADDHRIMQNRKTEVIEEPYLESGRERWIQTIKTPIQEKDGSISGILGIFYDITERKQAEDDLRESEAKFRSYIEYAPIGVFVVDRAGNYLNVNKVAQQMFGYEESTLTGMTIRDVISDEDREAVLAGFAQGLETGFSESEYRLKTREGNLLWVSARSQRLSSDRMIVFCLDITERQQMVEKLRQANQLLTTIIEASPLAIDVLDPEGNVQIWSRAAEQLYGWKAQEVIGHHLPSIPEHLSSSAQQHITDQMAGTTLTGYETQGRCADGSIVDVSLSTAPLYGPNGEITGAMSITLDITERKRVEKALREGEERYRRLFEDAILAIFQSTPDGLLLAINPAFAHMFGYASPEDALATIKDVATELYADSEARSEIVKKIKANTVPQQFEVEFRRRDGSSFLGNLHIRPVWSDRRNSLYFEGMIEDITERKQAEAQLRYQAELLNAVKDAVIATDADLKVTSWNPGAEAIYGWQANEVIGRFLPDVLQTEYDGTNRESVQNALNVSGDFHGEVKQRCKDGRLLPIESSVRLILDDKGAVSGFVGVNRNIFARKLAENELRQQKEILQKIFDHIPVMINLIDGDGSVLLANREWEQVLGWSLEEIQTQNLDILELMYPDSQKRLEVKEFLREAPSKWVDFKTRVRDGRWIDTSWTEVPLMDGMNLGIGQDITERKQADESLRKSEERFRSLFENMQGGFAYCQMIYEAGQPVDFIYLDVNDAFERLTGLKDIIGLPVTVAIPGIREANPELFEIYGRVASTGQPERFDDYFEGLKAWLSISVYSTEKGFFVAVFDNITERKRAEEALRRSEQKLALHIQKAPFAVIEWDTDFRVAKWNPAAEKIFGYTAVEAIGRTVGFIVPAHAQDHVDQVWNMVYHLNGNVASTNENITKDGRVIVCKWENTPLATPDGKVIAVASLAQDISEQVQAEKDLLQYRDHLEELVKERTARLEVSQASLLKYADEVSDLYNNAPCGYHSIDREGHVLSINDTELNWLGYVREEIVLQKKLIDLLTPESQARFRIAFPQFLKDGKVQNIEADIVRKDGEILPVLINATAVYDGEGQFVRSRETLLDNTERKHTEQALRESKETAEQANRAKSVFLANMSHEIRTPMNAILGFTQLSLRDAGLSSGQRQHLETIQRSGEHLLELINDILEMSKIEADRVVLNPSTFDLPGMIGELETLFQVRTEAKQLRFQVEQAADLPRYVVGDEGKLRQIFINLLGNAVKFTSQGEIGWRVDCHRGRGGRLRLCAQVFDTGPGIGANELGVLFKAFGQTTSGMKEGSGTGLGLAISARYAQLLGGELTVTSQVGEGSCFRVEVDLRAGKGGDARPVLNPRRVIGIKGAENPYRVLIVDDQPENRELIHELLHGIGFVTREAEDGEEALGVYTNWAPHLILMDMRMPKLDGYGAVRRIREVEGKERHTPIIAVTASAFAEEKKRILEMGADGYIRKPFKEQELLEGMGRLLGVEYEYAPEVTAPRGMGEAEREAQLMHWLGEQPVEWIGELRQSVLTANLDRLLQLIEDVAIASPQLADPLREFANNYQYDHLLKMLPGDKHVI
jgi:PAS domain S-box-containing protein